MGTICTSIKNIHDKNSSHNSNSSNSNTKFDIIEETNKALNKIKLAKSKIFYSQISGKKSDSKSEGQDSLDIINSEEFKQEKLTYIAIYDGHGEYGHLASSNCASMMNSYLIKNAVKLKEIDNIEEMQEFFICIIDKIQSFFMKNTRIYNYSGSCIIGVVVNDKNMYTVNLGDSRVVYGSKVIPNPNSNNNANRNFNRSNYYPSDKSYNIESNMENNISPIIKGKSKVLFNISAQLSTNTNNQDDDNNNIINRNFILPKFKQSTQNTRRKIKLNIIEEEFTTNTNTNNLVNKNTNACLINKAAPVRRNFSSTSLADISYSNPYNSLAEEYYKIIQLTNDHKVTDPYETELIISRNPKHNRNANRIKGLAISRTVGDLISHANGVSTDCDITIRNIENQNNPFILLGSDGLYDYLNNEEISGIISKSIDKNTVNKKIANDITSLSRKKYESMNLFTNYNVNNEGIMQFKDCIDDISAIVMFLNA